MRVLSKSRFQKGLQCEKALWLSIHRRDVATPPSESQEAVFDQGNEVGELARALFPGGVEITEDHLHGAEALSATARALSGGARVLYEPAFSHGGAFARVDILVATDGGRWDMYEVKSSASLKDIHVTDAAVQAFTAEGSGLPLRSVNIVHLNTSYVHHSGPYDLHSLFTIEDVTEAVAEYAPQVPLVLAALQEMLEGSEPAVRIGARCTSPYPCEFSAYCHAFLPADHPITSLPRLREEQLHALLDSGALCITEVPDDFRGLTESQREAVAVVKAGAPHADRAALARELGALRWPVYHLDFETVAPALPIWPDTRPYQAIPFQYSIHVQHEDGRLEHREYLHRGSDDPRPALARRLVDDLGTSGSVMHYTRYERTQLDSLAGAVPELGPELRAVMDRLFDLEPLIRNHTRHPAAAGRSSIKQVLPAWCPDCTYADLAISDGQMASVRYLRVVRGLVDQDEAADILSDLLEYCGLDTFAMVRLLDEMRRLSDEPE